MINVNEENFEVEVLKSTVPVVVDFWAPWCGPCKALAPMLEQVAGEFEGKVKFVKVNIDECDTLPSQFGVRGIPTLMAFNDGVPEATTVGFKGKAQLVELVQALVGE